MSELVNPAAVIEWNLDKTYQRQLEAAGVPVIPTTWVMPDDVWQPPDTAEFVIKPSVSAGGRNTARYSGGDTAALQHVRALQRAGQTVMVQEYLSAIDEDGEVDLVFFDGTFSHAAVKRPAQRTGEGVVERPWERMAWAGLAIPSSEQFKIAEQAMGVISDLLGQRPVYGRVDLIARPAGDPLVLEVELIDPYLSLDMEPGAATRLASALLHP